MLIGRPKPSVLQLAWKIPGPIPWAAAVKANPALADMGGNKSVTMPKWSDVSAWNVWFNNHIKWEADEPGRDTWQVALPTTDWKSLPDVDAVMGIGDCEDIALSKALWLAPRWPYPLRIAVGCLRPTSTAHAVLLLEDERGRAWAMDNRLSGVIPAKSLNMDFIACSEPGEEHWRMILP